MATKDRPRLGRGLKSLLSAPIGVHGERMAETIVSTADSPPASEGLQNVDLALIDPNPHQPRATMDAIALSELAASIKASGILQPVILRPTPAGRYQLVAGHRRTEAAKLAGLAHIPPSSAPTPPTNAKLNGRSSKISSGKTSTPLIVPKRTVATSKLSLSPTPKVPSG